MRRQRFVFLMCVLFALIAVVGLGCKNQFLEKPTFGSSNVANNEQSTGQTTGSVEGFGAPSSLKATQGGYREITLSWNPVQDAVRYYVYRANTQFETFVQVGETGDSSTSYTMKVQSGADFYYRVTAVNHAGEESRFSTIVRGTSLAQPLVSGVEGVEGKEDSDVTVYWYMGNVDAYQTEVRYNVICYDNKGTELARVVVDGSIAKETAAVISGLIPNTSYTYEVEAYIVSAQDKVEKCEPIDAATARRLRPNAPENLVIQQGQSKDGITLSFNLPALVDVALPGGVYEQKPLYFKIYRREYEEGSTDTEKGWVLLKADFGKTDTVPGENETQKVNFGNGDEEYTPGAIVTWTDENKLNRGVKYEYKVQSFAYYERDLTSKYSASTQVGWLIAKAEFRTGKYDPVLNEDNTAYISATLGFNFLWDTMGLDDSYHFLLAETRWSLEGDEDDSTSKEKETIFEKFTTIQAVNDYVRSFNSLDKKDARGYYLYKLTIFGAKNEELLVLNSLGRAIVTNEIDLPVIKLFSATSGYENKVELQWQHNPSYTYTISYSDESGADSQTIDNETLYTRDGQKIQPAEGEIVTYTHTVDSGKKYEYKLSVKDKISVDSLPIIASTSKKPEVRKTNPSYDSITVAWEDVPASSFAVSAKYADSDVATRNIIEPQELEGNDSDNLSKVERTVTFSQPAGYNDATISGKPIAVTVVADIPVTRTVHKLDGDVGSSYDITTESVETINLSTTTETATMGPALVGAKTSVGTYSDKITLSWNKVEGATAYVIYRNSLHISSKSSGNNLITEFEGTDKFIVTDVESETPSLTLDPAPTDTAFVAKYMSVARTDNKFTLTDMLCVEDLTDETLGRWHRAQSQISWGAPYEYIVLPLLTSTAEVEYDYETGPAVATVDTVALTSVPHEAGATKGYAWNVKATKGTYSENGENTGVKLTWTRPWAMPEHSYTVFRSESTNSEWVALSATVDKNATDFVDKDAIPGVMYQYMIAPAVNEQEFYPHKNVAYKKHFDEIQDTNYIGERLANGFMLPQVKPNVTKKNLDYYVDLAWNAPDTAGQKNYLFDGYVIEVLNNNIDDQWHEVATLTFGDSIQKNPSYKYSVKNQQNNLLKVLRDYKFYFRIRSYIVDDTGEKLLSKAPSYTWTDKGENEYVQYGTRQVSLEEFAKMALVNLVEPQETYRGDNGFVTNKYVNVNDKEFESSTAGGGYVAVKIHSDYNEYTAQPMTRAGRRVSGLTLKGKLQGYCDWSNTFPTDWWTGNWEGVDPQMTVTYPGYGTGIISINKDTNRTRGGVYVQYNGQDHTYDTSSEILKKLPLPLNGDGSFDKYYNTEYWK